MNTLFQSSWSRAWQGVHAIGDGLAVRDALLARYAEPHRKYHTLQHLEECLALFDSVRQAADRPAEVELALWFHDAIYDLGSSDNESRSAAWAREALHAAGVSEDACVRIQELVLKTRHTEIPDTRDETVLIDIDLAILGASPARFAEYERQIRDEYSYVPASVFRSKRLSILESFLDRPSIYGTPELHRRFEAQARENLAAAISANS